MSQQTKQEDPSEWSDDPDAEQVPCYQHARWDEIIETKDARYKLYTTREIQKLGYCAFLKEENGITKFRCIERLTENSGLCHGHHQKRHKK